MQIDTNRTLKNSLKLEALYVVKDKAEYNKAIYDSGYAAALMKIAKYEFIEKNDYNLSIKYSIEALHLNSIAAKSNSVYLNIYGTSNLAYYYESKMIHRTALVYYDSVILLCKKFYDPGDYELSARYYKVDINFSLGDYQKVIDESIVGMNAAKAAKDTGKYVYFLNQYAQSLFYEDNLQQALFNTDSAVLIANKIHDFYELATAYKTKALVYEKLKSFIKAKYFFTQAINARLNTPQNRQIASDYNDLGNFYLNSLSDYSNAKRCYNKTIRYANLESDSLQRSFNVALASINLGNLNTSYRKFKEALRFYSVALQNLHISTKNFLSSNPSTKQLNTIPSKDVLFALLLGKIQLLLKLLNETGEKNYLTFCLQTAAVTDTIITQTRQEQSAEQSKLYWRNKTREFFTNAMEACFLDNNAEQAFYFMEKSRAVLLSDKLNELGADAHLLPAEAAKQESLQRRIIETQQMLFAINPASKQYAEKQGSLSLLRDEQDKFIQLLEKNHPAYYQYKYADTVPSLQLLQHYLAKNHQSFVHYFMTDSVMYALGISPNKTTLKKLTAKDFDSRQLAEFLNLCRNKFALNNHNDIYAAMAQNIYKKIFEPLHLPPGNIAVCTDNFVIPFEALCTDSLGKIFLLYQYNFSYVYSARSLIKPFAGNAASRNFIGFAPVTFAQNLLVTPLNQSAKALSKSADFYNNATLFTDKQATRNSFFSNASNYAVINIFSHAQADTSDQEPRLYMQDSVIYLSELQYLKNPSAQFVLLSACQTNIGKTATGEGIYSLARGFALAGIPAVSATLWNADERTVYEISGKFNEYLAAGMNKSEALQKAKIWFIKNNENSELALPYYWANMILTGSSQPVVLAKENYTWQWIAGAAFVLLLVALSIVLSKRKKIIRINFR